MSKVHALPYASPYDTGSSCSFATFLTVVCATLLHKVMTLPYALKLNYYVHIVSN